MKYQFIKQFQKDFQIGRMCRIIGVKRSAYYAWKRRPNSLRAKKDQEVTLNIRRIHKISGQKYGSPRIFKQLCAEGFCYGRNRIAKIMRKNGIQARMKKRFKITTDSSHSMPVAENILNRNFKVDGPNKAWVSDITYIWTFAGWLYLCVILDLYSRRIVGWSMSDRMKAGMVVAALEMACRNRHPEKGLIFHSDRGSQYASVLVRTELKNRGIVASMSRKGNCWDNACAESFFHSLKTEELIFCNFQNREDAKICIFRYIEVFYNRMRLHSYLGYKCPSMFEEGR